MAVAAAATKTSAWVGGAPRGSWAAPDKIQEATTMVSAAASGRRATPDVLSLHSRHITAVPSRLPPMWDLHPGGALYK